MQIIATDKAPAAVGAYSQATVSQGMVYVSGQLGLNPATGALVNETVEGQAKQAMENIGAILAAAGSDFSKAVKLTIFLADIADFAAVNEIYGEYFPTNPPARCCLEVAALPKNGLVEIDCIAEV